MRRRKVRKLKVRDIVFKKKERKSQLKGRRKGISLKFEKNYKKNKKDVFKERLKRIKEKKVKTNKV